MSIWCLSIPIEPSEEALLLLDFGITIDEIKEKLNA